MRYNSIDSLRCQGDLSRRLDRLVIELETLGEQVARCRAEKRRLEAKILPAAAIELPASMSFAEWADHFVRELWHE